MLGVIFWMYGGYAWLTNSVVLDGLVLLAGALGGTAEYVLWALAFAAEWITPLLAGTGSFDLAPGHFVERHGLVVLIAIGESVVAVGIGASHLDVDAKLIAIAVL